MDTKSRRSQSVFLLLLLALFGAAGASNPAEARTMACEEHPTYGGLYCNDGSPITVCDLGDGECTVNCGYDDVPLPCIEPE